MSELEAIAARLAAATQGPWEVEHDSASGRDEFYGYWHRVGPFELLGKEPNADSIFIAHAPADIAYLLAQLARAEQVLSLLIEATCGGEVSMPLDALKDAKPLSWYASGGELSTMVVN